MPPDPRGDALVLVEVPDDALFINLVLAAGGDFHRVVSIVWGSEVLRFPLTARRLARRFQF